MRPLAALLVSCMDREWFSALKESDPGARCEICVHYSPNTESWPPAQGFCLNRLAQQMPYGICRDWEPPGERESAELGDG